MDANKEIGYLVESLQPVSSTLEDERQKIEGSINNEEPLLVYPPEEKISKRRTTKTKVHKQNIVFPDRLFFDLQRLADRNQISINELIKRFAMLGIIAELLEDTGGSLIIRRQGYPDQKITLIV